MKILTYVDSSHVSRMEVICDHCQNHRYTHDHTHEPTLTTKEIVKKTEKFLKFNGWLILKSGQDICPDCLSKFPALNPDSCNNADSIKNCIEAVRQAITPTPPIPHFLEKRIYCNKCMTGLVVRYQNESDIPGLLEPYTGKGWDIFMQSPYHATCPFCIDRTGIDKKKLASSLFKNGEEKMLKEMGSAISNAVLKTNFDQMISERYIYSPRLNLPALPKPLPDLKPLASPHDRFLEQAADRAFRFFAGIRLDHHPIQEQREYELVMSQLKSALILTDSSKGGKDK